MNTTKTVTTEMIKNWVGSDNMSSDDFLSLLEEIINGRYPVGLFRAEVLEYNEEEV